MQVEYTARDSVYEDVRQLLALPYLPAEKISRAFHRIRRHSVDADLNLLYDYVERTWIGGAQWPPSAWSVFRATVRTNNDVEGWHRRLNNRATRGQLQLYVLVPLLHREASILPLQVKLVNEKKLQRRVFVYLLHMPSYLLTVPDFEQF